MYRLLRTEELRVGRADDPLDVEELRHLPLQDGGEQHARPVGPAARDQRLLDDVEDAADDQSHPPSLTRIHGDLDRLVGRLAARLRPRPAVAVAVVAGALAAEYARHVDERQDVVAV